MNPVWALILLFSLGCGGPYGPALTRSDALADVGDPGRMWIPIGPLGWGEANLTIQLDPTRPVRLRFEFFDSCQDRIDRTVRIGTEGEGEVQITPHWVADRYRVDFKRKSEWRHRRVLFREYRIRIELSRLDSSDPKCPGSSIWVGQREP